MPAVDDLAERPPRAAGVVDRGVRRQPERHAFLERPAVVGNGDEVTDERLHHPVAARDRVEHLRKGPAARPPELVGVTVHHPVGAVLGRRQLGHSRDPLPLPELPGGLAQQTDTALALVPLEDLARPVARAVVRRDHEVDAGREVERQMLLDDVALVADEQSHDDPHGRGP